MRTPFRAGGRVTAGNSAGLTDGATACFLAAEETAAELGLEPKMRLVGFAFAGVEPELMGIGPIPATKRVLEQSRPDARRRRPLRAERAFRRAGADLVRRHGRRSRGSAPQSVRRRDRLRASARSDGRAADGAARVRVRRASRRALRTDGAVRRDGYGRGSACGRTLAPVTEFKLARAGDVALVTIDNGEDWTKPTFFGQEALESLDRLLGELEGGDFRAAVITGKPFVFAAGADITEFPDITPSARSRAHARDTSCSGDCARCRSRPSRRSTAPVSAAASSWRCTARRERSRPGFATSPFRRSSSASFPRGAARSFCRGSSGRRPRSR